MISMNPFFDTRNTMFLQLDDLTRCIAQVGFFSTAVTVVVFNVLTLFFVRRDFGTYRNVLISFSLVGFLFSSTEYIVHPMLHSRNSGFVFFTTSSRVVSNEVIKVGLVAFCGVYGSTVCFIAVQFLYRYWAIFDASKLRYFEGWNILIWFFYSFTVGATWAVGIYTFLANDSFSREFFKNDLLKYYNLELSKIPSFTSVLYANSGETRSWNLMCTIEMTLIIGSQYMIICFCGQQMSVGMKEKISMLSETRRRLHTQFFKSLVLQIFVPTVVLFLPMISIIYLPLLDIKFSFPTGILFSAFALYPAIDIIIIMYIVSDYQMAIKSICVNVKLLLDPTSQNFRNRSDIVVIPCGPPCSPIALNPPPHVGGF